MKPWGLLILLSLSAWGAVDINTATLSELEAVKGIGPEKARAIVAYRQGDNKYDFKVELDKDHDAAAATSGKVEARYRRYFDKLAGIEPSVRVSLGESMNTGSDFAFYTVQPKLSYELGNGWEPYVSVRYRDAFETSHDYFTRTFYLGAAYEVNKDWEIEPSYFHKNGVEKSNGIKLEVTRSF